MSIFIIILILIFLIGGIMSRSKPTILRDNDNAHLFDNNDGFVQNKSINKEDLKNTIGNLYERKEYQEVKNKIFEYLEYYNEDSFINFLLVCSLVELKELELAEKYANNVLYQLDNNKMGYFLLGYIKFNQNETKKSIEYMQTAMSYGVLKSSITEVIFDTHYLNELFNENDMTANEYDDLPY